MAERREASLLKLSGTSALSCSGRPAASTLGANRDSKRRTPAPGSLSSLATLPPLLTMGEVATVLRTSRKAVYAMADRVQLPGVTRIGRRLPRSPRRPTLVARRKTSGIAGRYSAMTIKVRDWNKGKKMGFEVDIRFTYPDGTPFRRRIKAPVESKSAAKRWGEAKERELLMKPSPLFLREQQETRRGGADDRAIRTEVYGGLRESGAS